MTVVVMVGLMMVVEVGSEIMAATHHGEQHKAQYAQDNFSAHGQTSEGFPPSTSCNSVVPQAEKSVSLPDQVLRLGPVMARQGIPGRSG